jgi:hypothetical protein
MTAEDLAGIFLKKAYAIFKVVRRDWQKIDSQVIYQN